MRVLRRPDAEQALEMRLDHALRDLPEPKDDTVASKWLRWIPMLQIIS
jgi:hypothetical protein